MEFLLDRQIDTMGEQALHWLVHQTSGNFSAKDQQDFERWLAANDDHRDAFARVRSLWDELAALAPAVASPNIRACDRKPDVPLLFRRWRGFWARLFSNNCL